MKCELNIFIKRVIVVNIYTYLNYREFLKDILIDKKKESPRFSHRYILGKMGISSSGYLLNVVSNKSSLSIQRAIELGSLLSMSKNEITYFRKLIYFDKAKSIDEKNDYYREILDFRKRQIKIISPNDFSLFSEWYYVVIIEILNIIDFKDDYSYLANLLSPTIKKVEAKNSIKVLLDLEFISEDKNGFFKPIEKAITTGDDIIATDVTLYQNKMISLEQIALETIPINKREISGLTFSVSKEKFSLIKDEIIEFRRRILQITLDDDNPQDVYRCNLGLFPITNLSKED